MMTEWINLLLGNANDWRARLIMPNTKTYFPPEHFGPTAPTKTRKRRGGRIELGLEE